MGTSVSYGYISRLFPCCYFTYFISHSLMNTFFFDITGYLPNYGSGHSGEGGGYYNSSCTCYMRGLAYDDFKEPTEAGSGSDTASGGGVLKLEASGTVEIQGEINAE